MEGSAGSADACHPCRVFNLYMASQGDLATHLLGQQHAAAAAAAADAAAAAAAAATSAGLHDVRPWPAGLPAGYRLIPSVVPAGLRLAEAVPPPSLKIAPNLLEDVTTLTTLPIPARLRALGAPTRSLERPAPWRAGPLAAPLNLSWAALGMRVLELSSRGGARARRSQPFL